MTVGFFANTPARSQAAVHQGCSSSERTSTEENLESLMFRGLLVAGAACVALGAVVTNAQNRSVPRPPAQPAGQQPPGESAAPDGYQPIPQWLGQTHAPVPAKSETFTVETFAEGLTGAFSFHFLPDGRIIVGERAAGRIRIVGKDG